MIYSHRVPSSLVFSEAPPQGNLVRFIYVDEAGTSQHEPVRVVAAAIIHADSQLRLLREQIDSYFREHVPSQYRETFWFHAKEIFSGGKSIDRDVWPKDERLAFYKGFLDLVRAADVPIALGCVFSGQVPLSSRLAEVDRPKIEHAMAFNLCVERAELFLTHHLHSKEAATIVAEDVPDMRSLLSRGFQLMKQGNFNVSQADKRPSRVQRERLIAPEPANYHIKCIEDVPHFVAKGGAPLLQVSDACAFAFRRCLSKQSEGDELLLALLGERAGREFIENDEMFRLGSGALLNTSGKH